MPYKNIFVFTNTYSQFARFCQASGILYGHAIWLDRRRMATKLMGIERGNALVLVDIFACITTIELEILTSRAMAVVVASPVPTDYGDSDE